eukprot:snap_masked-scaffold136_size321413-processed-gene-1.0 protein:Tk06259 transcript:snap_masked-scaffold136_size321413-processed-gene-1.0-mRNA-1 annotation:"bcs-1 protein"
MQTFAALLALAAIAVADNAPYRPAPAYNEEPAAYQYQYAVADEYAGVNFGQNEARDGYATNGEYRVNLPDGRTQIVTYNVADAYSGYVADVRYDGEAKYEPYQPAPYKPAPYQPAPYKAAPAPYKPAPYKPAPAPYKAAPSYSRDDLGATIGKIHTVLAIGGITITSLVLAKVHSGVFVSHGVLVLVGGRLFVVSRGGSVGGVVSDSNGGQGQKGGEGLENEREDLKQGSQRRTLGQAEDDEEKEPADGLTSSFAHIMSGESENLHLTKPQERAGYPAFPPSDDSRQPYFRTHGQTYRIKVGDPVTMTCKVENLGSSVIVWKQTDRIISAGERLIRKDPRMKLVREPNGISLHITHVTPDDRGSYICELETYGEPIHQTNSLDVLGESAQESMDCFLSPSKISNYELLATLLLQFTWLQSLNQLKFVFTIFGFQAGSTLTFTSNFFSFPINITPGLPTVPPSITILNTGNSLSLRKDSTVSLACNASGFPPPRIMWQREECIHNNGAKQWNKWMEFAHYDQSEQISVFLTSLL